MTFQLHPLAKEKFEHLFELSDDALIAQGARRVTADACPGFPCRVSLQDAQVGEELILLNYQHVSGNTPFAASHGIYVRKGAVEAEPTPGDIPEVIASRLLSVRGFDAQNMLRDADVVEGRALAAKLEEMFAVPGIDFVDIHNARQGCFAARATRA